MRQARFLSINAHIEAARAGQAGVAFTILADEMGKIAGTITNISNELRGAIQESTSRLHLLGADLVLNYKGSRFIDLALNVIELIDRNLYERSCDVRWWATDSAVVDAASTSLRSDIDHACQRLHTILKSYTVYLDLCIADRHGKIIACGRPNLYTGQIGADIGGVEWFRNAMQTKSGDEFVVADVRRSPVLNNAITATYATAIRENGETNGKIIGALGIAFDWLPQAQAIVKGVHLSDDEKATTRVMILDAAHRIIAASDDAGILTETLPFEPTGPRGFYARNGRLIAYALTPGYETYRGLGWYGVIETRLEG